MLVGSNIWQVPDSRPCPAAHPPGIEDNLQHHPEKGSAMRHPFITARVVRQAPAASDTSARERPLHDSKVRRRWTTRRRWQLTRLPDLATKPPARHLDRVR
jgi:hypothetical protein